MIVPPEHSIVLSLLPALETSLLGQVRAEISRIFCYKTEVIPLLMDVGFALDTGRNQHHSTIILEKLADLAPLHAVKVIGILQVDLFIPILTHVYGEAQLGGKTCVVSTHRLKEGLSSMRNPETYNRRVTKEIIHELGHTFGLRHCREQSCIMHYARSIDDVDEKSDQLCRYCKVLLEDEITRLAKAY